jgi:hypothetical protein
VWFWFTWQSEKTFANDVALHLASTACNATTGRHQHAKSIWSIEHCFGTCDVTT